MKEGSLNEIITNLESYFIPRRRLLSLFSFKQARYRQYFEEDPAMASVVSGDATGIPMETQYLMQEVLTDGMAFCSLM